MVLTGFGCRCIYRLELQRLLEGKDENLRGTVIMATFEMFLL